MPQDLDELARRIRDAFRAGWWIALDLASEHPVEPFQGAEGQCHTNAEAWHERHPGSSIAEGYITAAAGCYAPHSVVRSNAGRLLDVTLLPGAPAFQRRFVRHADVSAEPFCRLASINLPVDEQLTEMVQGLGLPGETISSD